MKKTTKKLLVGTGLAVAGLMVYFGWKDAEKSVMAKHTVGSTGSTTPTKEYVEHRRQQIREAAEARKAAQQETVVLPSEEKMPQDGAHLHEAGEAPEESSTTPTEQNAAPVEPAPLERAEEQQEERQEEQQEQGQGEQQEEQ